MYWITEAEEEELLGGEEAFAPYNKLLELIPYIKIILRYPNFPIARGWGGYGDGFEIYLKGNHPRTSSDDFYISFKKSKGEVYKRRIRPVNKRKASQREAYEILRGYYTYEQFQELYTTWRNEYNKQREELTEAEEEELMYGEKFFNLPKLPTEEKFLRAARDGDEIIVDAYIRHGADVNIIDEYGRSALILASSNEHTEIVRILLNAGADVNSVDKYGRSALMFASMYGRTEIVRILLNAGADVNSVDKDGRSALMWASKNAHTEIVQLLLDAGADVNTVDKDGWSALMWASSNEHTEIENLLRQHGAR